MKKFLLILSCIFVTRLANAQTNAQTVFVTVAPSGSCQTRANLRLVTPAGTLYSCQSNVWTIIGGGGGGCTLAGAITGTCAATVISNSVAIPGNPTTTTQSAGNNSTRVATTAFVTGALGLYLPLAGGTMTGNILFTDGLYDLGATGATRPRNIFLSGTMTSVNATVSGLGGGGTLYVTTSNTGVLGTSGAVPFNGAATGSITAQASITITDNANTFSKDLTCQDHSSHVKVIPDTITYALNTSIGTFSPNATVDCLVLMTGGTPGSSGVTSVSGTGSVGSTGGSTPVISNANCVGDSGSGGTAGNVPAPGAGDAAAGKVLGAGCTWGVVSSNGTSTVIIVTSHGNHTSNGSISTEFFASCDTTSGSVTLTLGSSPTTGTVGNIKRKYDGTGNLCIIDGNGKTIDNGPFGYLTSDGTEISIYYDGTQWWVI